MEPIFGMIMLVAILTAGATVVNENVAPQPRQSYYQHHSHESDEIKIQEETTYKKVGKTRKVRGL